MFRKTFYTKYPTIEYFWMYLTQTLKTNSMQFENRKTRSCIDEKGLIVTKIGVREAGWVFTAPVE